MKTLQKLSLTVVFGLAAVACAAYGIDQARQALAPIN